MKSTETNSKNLTANNPLLKPSPLENQAVPFDHIQTEHFLPALIASIEEAESELKSIKENGEDLTFENTIEAIETCGEQVDVVAGVFYNLLSAHTNDQLQDLAQEIGPRLSEFSSDILLDETLFKRVRAVYDQRKTLHLSQEQSQLLENTYTDFVRNGALLTAEQKKRLRQIDQELSTLSPRYSDNVLRATNAFELLIENKEDLAGLPDSIVEAARQTAQEKGHDQGWFFNLDFPSYFPFVKYCAQRNLREKMWLASNSRSFRDDYDNQEIILQIVRLRWERAQLLGYPSHAHFVITKRMAESPKRVHGFLDELLTHVKGAAENDLKDIRALAKELDEVDSLEPWDYAYYAEKLKEKEFSFNEEELRPYFKLENVVTGLFEHARRLFQLTFKMTDKYPVYHKDVKVYEVFDEESSRFVGLFYADFFPRPSKRGGAWMTTFKDQGLFRGEVGRPHVSIVCNLTKPTEDRPSLLTHNEVRTLFHEFGHALHGLLSQCHYRSLGGTHVYWDFVELPSQILENWTLEKEGLDLFARHFETNETIPEDLAHKLKMSSKFQTGFQFLRQLNFALLDIGWHDTDPEEIEAVLKFENKVTSDSSLFKPKENTSISCVFSHIFAGGYSAGYYSYKWAEVLDADAFELFEKEGLFNREVAQSFKKNILEKGGTKHPMELYKAFRGREPDTKALLRRDGLLNE